MSEIFFSPFNQVLSNYPPGTLVVGVPGSGKTFAMLNLASGCIDFGANIFTLDAKNDMLRLKNIFPDIKITDVNKIAPGSLDPFLVFNDIDATVILTITEILCGGDLTTEQKLAITPIINDFVVRAQSTNTASFRDFADYLYQHQNTHAQAIGNQLLINADTKYGALLFGKFGVRANAVTFKKNENRVISIFGMTLPTGSESPKPDELVASATVYILCKMMKDILTRGSQNNSKISLKKEEVDKTPTVLFLDECHMLMKSRAIKDVIDELLVLGRSLGVALVLASQNVTHFDEKIAQHVASKFCFRMSKKEAQEFFDMFDNSSSEHKLEVFDCIDTTTRLNTGYCYFIDAKERATLMHVTSPYDSGDLTSNPLMKSVV